MNKKAYFFTMDGIIALIVLTTGIIVMGSILVGQPIFQPPYNYGEDLLRAMSSSNISNFKTATNPGISKLFIDNKIISNESSVLQQVGSFYYDYCKNKDTFPNVANQAISDANTTVSEIISLIIPNPFYAELSFVGCDTKMVYTSFIPADLDLITANKAKSKVSMVTQKIVFGNKDSSTLFGPYIAKMTLWR
ncbi:MAG: hypothetical protein WC471_02040 [Candidatus Woesearchaeota archaeon]